MEGRILAINTGSTSTKIGFFDAGVKVFEQNIAHSAETLAKYKSVMDQEAMRRDSITDFLLSEGIELESIDVVMARGGLITPVVTGVYEVNKAMCDMLVSARNGEHACNLSAIIASDIAEDINRRRLLKGIGRQCRAFIADSPMADEMIPEAKLGGRPEFPRRTLFHALNSRAMVRRYAKSAGKSNRELTVIVAHMGGGSSVSIHRNGKVIDTTDSHGGDGPITPERAGTVPAFPLVEMCFSGKYTKAEVKKMLVGNGGAVSYFGTNDFLELTRRADAGDKDVKVFLDAYCLSIAKYIGYFSTVVCGKVDAIILTGGIARNVRITDNITEHVSFIAPVVIYPGEDELQSLAENGYGVLSGEFEVLQYHC
ncbi:MAG: butyrate kinase [Bacteroidales bacterium]|nr:butyrate kinase [Bacteroidales bacterium]